ncbi:hypothetical protein KGM_209944 [Danaus plexippus plexippus]|uniref:Uncharacterized protein n=1 Tax=Danaus plexippus plexippus TaxID=278856 RepID=A0A212FHT6_DANPL|nr:hypothetical protein KGM_209944 [Danaus plexippus plexippus]
MQVADKSGCVTPAPLAEDARDGDELGLYDNIEHVSL